MKMGAETSRRLVSLVRPNANRLNIIVRDLVADIFRNNIINGQ